LLAYAILFVGQTPHFRAAFDASRRPFNGSEVCAASPCTVELRQSFFFPSLFSLINLEKHVSLVKD